MTEATALPRSSAKVRRRWGPLRSLLALSPVLIGAPLLGLYQHFDLASPLTDLINPTTLRPQISEARILNDTKYLSEGIGYRTVGTKQHALADQWMTARAWEMQRVCQEAVSKSGGTRKLECEVWRQEGSGSHRFDMMSKRLYKTYVSLSNIVIRVSDGTDSGKAHAVLVNAHLDSTLPSPGAADDAISVAIMLDCIRVLASTPDWEPTHAIIFLFNHAEESLQDGSHLYSTQHSTASTVRAVINLEAAGTEGRELLFQATSPQMVRAYSHVPRPFGTIFANDIFSSGILLSDTDFRQFEQYLDVTGLDIAVVGNSYLYHMRKDLVENIQPGVAQNMGENTLALLKHLSSSSSPLPELALIGKDSEATHEKTIYFSFLGIFFMYSATLAKGMYAALALISIGVVAWTRQTTTEVKIKELRGNGVAKEKLHTVKKAGLGKAMLAAPLGLLGAVVAPNLVAVIMANGLGKGMSWFSSAYAPLGLFAPAAVGGVFASQLLLVGRVDEHDVLSALLLVQSFLALGVQLLGVGSSVIFFLAALPMAGALALNSTLTTSTSDHDDDGQELRGKKVSLWTYALGSAVPLMNGTILVTTVIEVFVPLTGRLGEMAPADNIVGSIVSILGFIAFPLVVPYAHRFSAKNLRRSVFGLAGITAVMMGIYAMKLPFDAMHQKRLFVLHLENITNGETHLHIATADGAPGFKTLVQDMTDEFAAVGQTAVPIVMNDSNADWDSLYPFSGFLSPYKVALPAHADIKYASPWVAGAKNEFSVSALEDEWDWEKGERQMVIEVKHPGLIWTVIAFDAHVLQWSLDKSPPEEHDRHFIKEASYYGVGAYTFDLVVRIDKTIPDSGRLHVNFIGLQEDGLWPAKKTEFEALRASGSGGERQNPAMVLFEQVDGWLDEKMGGTVDALLMGCVAGIVTV